MCNGLISDKLISFALPPCCLEFWPADVAVDIVVGTTGKQALVLGRTGPRHSSTCSPICLSITGANVLSGTLAFPAGKEAAARQDIPLSSWHHPLSGIMAGIGASVTKVRCFPFIKGTPDECHCTVNLYMRIYSPWDAILCSIIIMGHQRSPGGAVEKDPGGHKCFWHFPWMCHRAVDPRHLDSRRFSSGEQAYKLRTIHGTDDLQTTLFMSVPYRQLAINKAP